MSNFEYQSLLPPNATDTERDLEQTLSQFEQIDVPIDILWNPHTCPAEWLPWLAWAMSVDDWDSRWPEQIRRQVIAESFYIHSRKGTIAAIKRIFEALNIHVELKEWFEFGGIPHTFRLTAWANQNLWPASTTDSILSRELYQIIRRAVDQTKPVRSHYKFLVGAQYKRVFGLATALRAIPIVHLEWLLSPRLNIPSIFGIAAYLRGLLVNKAGMTLLGSALPIQNQINNVAALRPIQIIQRHWSITNE